MHFNHLDPKTNTMETHSGPQTLLKNKPSCVLHIYETYTLHEEAVNAALSQCFYQQSEEVAYI